MLNWHHPPFDSSDDPQPVLTECEDWYAKTEKVIFLERDPDNSRISLNELYFTSLRGAAHFLGNGTGLKTAHFFSDWKNRLLSNEPLLHNDLSLIDPMWCDYAEKRFYAGQFMLQLTAFLPQYKKELHSLWTIYGQRINRLIYDYIGKVDLQAGALIESMNREKLNDEAVRKEMCRIIDQCEEEERRAADIINDLVQKISIW